MKKIKDKYYYLHWCEKCLEDVNYCRIEEVIRLVSCEEKVNYVRGFYPNACVKYINPDVTKIKDDKHFRFYETYIYLGKELEESIKSKDRLCESIKNIFKNRK